MTTTVIFRYNVDYKRKSASPSLACGYSRVPSARLEKPLPFERRARCVRRRLIYLARCPSTSSIFFVAFAFASRAASANGVGDAPSKSRRRFLDSSRVCPANLLSRLLHALLEHLARAFLGAHLLRRLLGVELLGLVVPDSRKRGVERVSPNDRAAGFDGRDAWETAGRVPRADEAAGRGAGSTYAQMLPTKKTSTSVETMPMIRYAGFDSESAMASGPHEARSKD